MLASVDRALAMVMYFVTRNTLDKSIAVRWRIENYLQYTAELILQTAKFYLALNSVNVYNFWSPFDCYMWKKLLLKILFGCLKLHLL